jgi:hypothetical protein
MKDNVTITGKLDKALTQNIADAPHWNQESDGEDDDDDDDDVDTNNEERAADGDDADGTEDEDDTDDGDDQQATGTDATDESTSEVEGQTSSQALPDSFAEFWNGDDTATGERLDSVNAAIESVLLPSVSVSDLPLTYRRIIAAYVHDSSQTQQEIAAQADCSASTVGSVLRSKTTYSSGRAVSSEDSDTEQTPVRTTETDTADRSPVDSTGITISGTSADDLGDERTTLLPAGVEDADLTDTKRRIINAWLLDRTASSYTIAERADANRRDVVDVLTELVDHSFSDSSAEPTEPRPTEPDTETDTDSDTGSDPPFASDTTVVSSGDGEDPEDQSTQSSLTGREWERDHEFEAAARAIKATAQTAETKQAIDHLLGIFRDDRTRQEEQDQTGGVTKTATGVGER